MPCRICGKPCRGEDRGGSVSISRSPAHDPYGGGPIVISTSGPGFGDPGNSTTRSGTFRTPDGGGGRWTVTETRYDSGWQGGSDSGSNVGPRISLGTGPFHGPPSSIASGSRISGSGSGSGSRSGVSRAPSSYISGSDVSRASRSGTNIGGGWTAEPGSPAASASGSQVSAAPSARSRASGASSRGIAPGSQVSGRSDSGVLRYPTASRGGSYVPSPLSGVSSQQSGGSRMLPGSRVSSAHSHGGPRYQ